MRIAITGETGFLGYYLTQYFKYEKKYDVITLGKNYQSNISLLKDCDWLIHCAGVNRGSDVGIKNINLVNELVNLLTDNQIKINIVFTSSVQIKLGNEYGNSKLECSRILNSYCKSSRTKYISYNLPNLFGPFSKPNYNSVVATFCYNIINEIPSNISDAELNLCYVHEAAKVISSLSETDEFLTKKIKIKNLYNLIYSYHKLYSVGVIPKFNNEFEINLFNTYRSFFKCDHTVTKKSDDRGYLIELIQSKGSESQVFFSTTFPNITRGNHFHFEKIERFCILKGKAKISMRKVGTSEIISYNIDDDSNIVVDMPVLYTHNITNIGEDELVCVFWTNQIYNESNPDTYFLKV